MRTKQRPDHTSPQTAMFTGEQMSGNGAQLNMLDQIRMTEEVERTPNKLHTIEYGYFTYFIDFRLEEIRRTDNPAYSWPFTTMPAELKARVRSIRAEFTSYGYIESLDK